ncbi:Type 1 glutamine amidotransferase-like domain-containing protein [Acholeplasma granularum]|uniref:Type 1 glutamine amidotransferase-like domain-containing protein n=1 Tax=Acholeplasma granularum TaxID=264635 RepID=UPI00046F23A5|nr:Type 1 glutamine amidotransferase-like domain-containing protein [Acholeplasma granularum]
MYNRIMINILSSKTIYDKPYVVEKLKKYIKPESKICVIAFSFFEKEDMLHSYYEGYKIPDGIWYLHILEPLLVYGIKPEQVQWVIYKKDDIESAKRKVEESDIIFLPGGAPDLFYKRLYEYDLISSIKNSSIVMGPSAGTMVQFNWFHISKDYDYKKYQLSDGIGLISDFGVEVHFKRRKQQKKSLRRVSHYNKRPVYTIEEPGFMILEDGQIIYQYMANKYYEKGRRIKIKA